MSKASKAAKLTSAPTPGVASPQAGEAGAPAISINLDEVFAMYGVAEFQKAQFQRQAQQLTNENQQLRDQLAYLQALTTAKNEANKNA